VHQKQADAIRTSSALTSRGSTPVVARPPVQHTLSGPAGSQQYHQNQHFSLASASNPTINNRLEIKLVSKKKKNQEIYQFFFFVFGGESSPEFGLTPLSVHRFPSRHDLAKKELTKELLTSLLRKEV
jgi:hypothetical protein